MSDPRSFTVKQCPPAYANKSAANIGSATSARRDFWNSIGKIGDLEVLNSVGAGKIGQGLRNLASISNTIRSGAGALPTSIGKTLDDGANWVLEQTGIGAPVVDALRGFNPGVANQAFGQAKAVFEKVSQGGFKATDIPSVLQDFQNLERLSSKIFTPGRGDAQSSLQKVCEASPYAIDMIARAPKTKFLFIVEFVPTNEYSTMPVDLTFVVKTTTRPNIKFQTEEVNYYNYRSTFVTKTLFEEMTMTFHDDNRNAATQFYETYLKAMSPIANIDPRGGLITSNFFEQGGMEFTDPQGNQNVDVPDMLSGNISANRYAGSSGTLADGTKTILYSINVYHVFDYGRRMTVYSFANPRITSLAPDDLDMSAGTEGSQLSITFSYDSVYVDPNIDLANDTKYGNIRDMQPGAVYQLQYHGTANTVGSAPQGSEPFGVPPNATPSGDPMQKISNRVNAALSSNPAVAAAKDLNEKFSNIT